MKFFWTILSLCTLAQILQYILYHYYIVDYYMFRFIGMSPSVVDSHQLRYIVVICNLKLVKF